MFHHESICVTVFHLQMSFLGLKSLDTLKTKCAMTEQVTLILQVHKYNDFWQDPANWMLCYANEVKMLQDPCCCYHGWRGFLHLNGSNSDSSAMKGEFASYGSDMKRNQCSPIGMWLTFACYLTLSTVGTSRISNGHETAGKTPSPSAVLHGNHLTSVLSS